MIVGLVLHHERPDALDLGTKFVKLASDEGLKVVAGPHDATRLGVTAADLTTQDLDAVVAVGGDGTVLEAARIGLNADAPILGVNAGRVGFLAEAEPESLPEAVRILAGGEWKESPAMTVEARMPDGSTGLGLNDVVIEKIASERMVSLELRANDLEVVTYHADGVVVCTPTGSTAYNLSVGGPLVDRRLEALIVTPIASHTLFSKSLVFSSSARLRCTVTHDRPVGVALDGQEMGVLEPGDHVDLCRGQRPARLMDLSGRSFDQAIRRKFDLK